MRIEAHALPFAMDYFEVIVSVDAYHYFGTDDLYLAWGLAPFMTRDGMIGVIVPGTRKELDAVPESLRPHWGPDFWTFHSPEWWRRNWERSSAVDVDVADFLSDGWDLWRLWAEVLDEVDREPAPDAPSPPDDANDLALLNADTDRLIGFHAS